MSDRPPLFTNSPASNHSGARADLVSAVRQKLPDDEARAFLDWMLSQEGAPDDLGMMGVSQDTASEYLAKIVTKDEPTAWMRSKIGRRKEER